MYFSAVADFLSRERAGASLLSLYVRRVATWDSHPCWTWPPAMKLESKKKSCVRPWWDKKGQRRKEAAAIGGSTDSVLRGRGKGQLDSILGQGLLLWGCLGGG